MTLSQVTKQHQQQIFNYSHKRLDVIPLEIEALASSILILSITNYIYNLHPLINRVYGMLEISI